MKGKYCLFLLAGVAAIVFTVGGIPSVYAQKSVTEEFQLEEVTVTAQKRLENQQKVPISMEVISGEELLGTGKDNVDDILRDISNVLINKSPDGMRVTVRGLADENSPFHDMHVSTPTVAVNIDGAYNSSSAAGQNLFDLERVEVLSGPQSTLYGSNSPGGIVNVVTASPKTDKFAASASVEAGNYGLITSNVMVNAPIIRDLVAMRLAGQTYKRDSWVEGSDNSQDTKTARLKTLYQPSEDFSATVTLNYSKAISGGRLGGDVKVFDYEDGHYWSDGTPVTNPWTANDSAGGGPPPGPPGPPSEGQVTGNAPNAVGQDAETKGIQAEISWNTPIGSLSFVPAYSKQKSTEFRDDVEVTLSTGTGYTSQFSENSTEQKNAELRLVSPADFFFKWIVGGTYYESERDNYTDDYYYDSNDSSQIAKEKNKAVYANITYPITDKFRGTAGYRRSWDEASNVEAPPKVGNGVSGQKYSNPDYRIGVEYDLAENSMMYADYATSYRVNAMAIAQGNKTVPPEELKSYSLGVKNRFFNNKLQLNASAYYYDYTNKNFRGSEEGRFGGAPGANVTIKESDYPHTDPATGEYLPGTDFNNDGDYNDTNLSPGDPGFDPATDTSELVGKDITDPWIQQFGQFESYGLDLSADWVITSKDRLNLSLSYLHAKWTDAVVEFYWSWIWPTNGLDLSGRTNTFSPKWSANASYLHNFELGSFGTLVPQIDVQYQSSYNLSFEQSFYPYNYQEAHYILNGSLTYTSAGGMWSVNAYVKNATDYAVKTFWMDMAGTYSLGLNDPRTYGAVLSVKF